MIWENMMTFKNSRTREGIGVRTFTDTKPAAPANICSKPDGAPSNADKMKYIIMWLQNSETATQKKWSHHEARRVKPEDYAQIGDVGAYCDSKLS